ncbi:MAG: monovalent cation/H+ antiporter subunit D family protein [Alphaproteobacteria bacterium]|nr:monovalent cation/H+ antiporter subunit D family protein [Alphaproteobacteria bacterium]
MSSVQAHLPALQVVLPLLGSLFAGFVRREATGFALALAVSWTAAVISAVLLWQVLQGGPISYHLGGWPPPWGIEYRIDLLNAFVLLLVAWVGAVTMPFARRSVAFEVDEGRQGWFYCMYLLCLTGLLGITVTGDAFNAFVFLEISSLSTYVLIALGRDRRALLSAFQYLIMGTIGATFYVIGVGFLYLVTGSLNMVDIAQRLGSVPLEQTRAVAVAVAFLTVGISLKLALFPLHVWLPNAYAYAPSLATAFLAGTATKVAVYLLVRFFAVILAGSPAFGPLQLADVLLVLSIAAMFVASAIAVFETNLKRMLAYSSLAQIGYITLGIGIANQAGLTGAIVHLFNHAIMKAALFLVLGAVFYRIGSVKLHDLAGIGPKMPLTMAAFAVAGFALIGTPGTSGFVSKWYLAVGAFGHSGWLLVLLIVASSLIAVVYVGRVVEVVWFRPPSPLAETAREVPPSMLVPILVLAGATIWFGIDTRLTADLAGKAAAMLLAAVR